MLSRVCHRSAPNAVINLSPVEDDKCEGQTPENMRDLPWEMEERESFIHRNVSRISAAIGGPARRISSESKRTARSFIAPLQRASSIRSVRRAGAWRPPTRASHTQTTSATSFLSAADEPASDHEMRARMTPTPTPRAPSRQSNLDERVHIIRRPQTSPQP